MSYLDSEEFWDGIYEVHDRLSVELDLSSLTDVEAVDLAASAVKRILAEVEDQGVADDLAELLSIWFSTRAQPSRLYRRGHVGELARQYGFRREDIPTPTDSTFRPADFLGMFATSRFANAIVAFQDGTSVHRNARLLDVLSYALYLSSISV